MSIQISKQITITPDSIFVGGSEIPGTICATDIRIIKDSELQDFWTVTLTLMTDVEPLVARSLTVDESGIVRPGGESA